jgi:site-specific DNA-methyltransferase (adenine-specific)
MRRTTKTQSFGMAGRQGHDSSAFYQRRLYNKGVSPDESAAGAAGAIEPGLLDTVVSGDSRRLDFLPDRSCHLAVTSPPYNAGKDYDLDLTLMEYRKLLKQVFSEVYRVLVPGGRLAVNVANLGRRPYIPLASYVAIDLIGLGYLMRGEVVWDKGASAGVSTAWGSWRQPANPTLRDVHEYVLVFSKEQYRRTGQTDGTLEAARFTELTRSVWHVPSVSARRIGHPAPFPEELPGRLIELYTYPQDVVLDPFAGSGQTVIAAMRRGRRGIGVEQEADYVRLANRRISAAFPSPPPEGG